MKLVKTRDEIMPTLVRYALSWSVLFTQCMLRAVHRAELLYEVSSSIVLCPGVSM